MSNLETVKAGYVRLLKETDFYDQKACLDALEQAFDLVTTDPGLPEEQHRPVIHALLNPHVSDKIALENALKVLEGFKE